METNTAPDIFADDYLARQARADAEWLVAARGRIVAVDRRSEGYDGDYWDVYTVAMWNGERVETNRYGAKTGRDIEVDAPAEIVEAANDYLEQRSFEALVERDIALANEPAKGKLVVIARGKAKHADGTSAKGFEGVIFWTQEQTFSPRYSNGYKTGPDTVKVGIAPVDAKTVNGKREGAVFTYLKNCDVLNADPYMTDVRPWRGSPMVCFSSMKLSHVRCNHDHRRQHDQRADPRSSRLRAVPRASATRRALLHRTARRARRASSGAHPTRQEVRGVSLGARARGDRVQRDGRT
jgi:hypothetical protein